MSARCRTCPHDKQMHQHLRPGLDCAVCRCPRYRRRWLPGRLRRRPIPQPELRITPRLGVAGEPAPVAQPIPIRRKFGRAG